MHLSDGRAWYDGLFDGEKGQASLRVVLPLVLLLAYGVSHSTGVLGDFARACLGLSAYTAFSLAWFVIVAKRLMATEQRRAAGVMLDHLFSAATTAIGGPDLLLMTWLPILMSVGNTLRYGAALGHLSAIMGCASTVVTYWHFGLFDKSAIYPGVALAALLVPVYSGRLSEKLAAEKLASEQAAKKLREQQAVDSLTGAANRVGFERRVAAIGGDLRMTSGSVAVFFIDLDGFKAVNDQCGHATGDVILIAAARALGDAVRTTDLVARLGGDEFAVLAEGVQELESAQRLADAMVSRVKAIGVPGRADLRVGASVGAVVVSQPDTGRLNQAVLMSDELMYQVKAAGKGKAFVRRMQEC